MVTGRLEVVRPRWAAWAVMIALAGPAASSARAYETCGSGGVTGERVMVELEGSLYYVTTPADYDPARPWPLILGLHGDEGDPARSVNWNWRSVTDGRFIFVAPKARNDSGSWYMATEDNTAFMDALIESLFAQYNVDLDRVYIWGLSGGAQFTSGYAFTHQDRFAAVQLNMGGSNWQYRSTGASSPDRCKIPARFVVSTTDFLRDGALALFDLLTESGHETEWLDADCEGHCWDDAESGAGARDWLLAHTLCGNVRPAGCVEGALTPPEPPPPTPEPTEPEPLPDDPAGDPTAGEPAPLPDAQPPGTAPAPEPATPVGVAGGAAPAPPPTAPQPGPAPAQTSPTAPPAAARPEDGGGFDDGGCRAAGGARGRAGLAWLAFGVAWSWRRRRGATRPPA